MDELLIAIAADAGLHDYRLNDICISYYDSSVIFELETPRMEKCKLIIENFVSFSIEHKEPWGAGVYIFDSELLEESECNKILLTLNSGDKILICYRDPKGRETLNIQKEEHQDMASSG